LAVWTSLPGSPGRMELLDDEQPLSVGDRLLYQVVEEREPETLVFVNDRGRIRFPLLGEVDASGRTPRELAFDLKDRLEEDFFYRATVLLRFPREDGSRGQVYVAGAVRRQGSYPIPVDQVMTVTNAIMAAGGLDSDADGEAVEVVRRDDADPDGEEVRMGVNVRAILDTGDFESDVSVRAGDVVVVPRREGRGGSVFVVGAVNSPGILEVQPGVELTVSKAILQRGGFTRFARKRSVKLIRGDTSLSESERTITVDVSDILERGLRENDPVVSPGDLIRVEERVIAF